MSVFAALIAPLTIEEFFSDYYAKQYAVLEPGDAFTKRFLTWDLLTSALSRASFDPHRNIVLTKTGEGRFRRNIDDPEHGYVHRETWRLDVAKVYGEVRDGATLVFNNIYKYAEGYSDLSREMEQLFLARPSINAYASTRPEPGLGMHWDSHDVFAIQSEGRKYWQLYGFTTQSPLSRETSPEVIPDDMEPVWEGYLEAGQCLYVPRGMWHCVLSTGKPSLHSTCGFAGVLVSDILNYLARSAEAEPLLRSNVHPDYMSDGALDLMEARIRDSMASLLGPGFIRKFWAARKMRAPLAPGRDSLGFDWSALDQRSDASFAFRGPYNPVLIPSAQGGVVAISGREFDIPRVFCSVFQRLASIGDASLSELMEIAETDGASFEELVCFLQLLHKHGLIGGVSVSR